MKAALREKIIAYNRTIAKRSEKASDLDALLAAFLKMPPGQLKKVLTEEVLTVLEKYGMENSITSQKEV